MLCYGTLWLLRLVQSENEEGHKTKRKNSQKKNKQMYWKEMQYQTFSGKSKINRLLLFCTELEDIASRLLFCCAHTQAIHNRSIPVRLCISYVCYMYVCIHNMYSATHAVFLWRIAVRCRELIQMNIYRYLDNHRICYECSSPPWHFD